MGNLRSIFVMIVLVFSRRVVFLMFETKSKSFIKYF